jgi:hypothetical protein
MTFHEGPVDLEAMQRAEKAAPPANNLMIPRPTQAGAVLLVSKERLEVPSEWVTVMNTSPVQTHVVIDRYMNGHELPAGEKKEIEMLVDEMEAFRQLGRPNRGVCPEGPLAGQPLPPHPLRFIDLPEPPSAGSPALPSAWRAWGPLWEGRWCAFRGNFRGLLGLHSRYGPRPGTDIALQGKIV